MDPLPSSTSSTRSARRSQLTGPQVQLEARLQDAAASLPRPDVFEPQMESVSPSQVASGVDAPAPVKTGTADYYRQRYYDFVRRNPGVTPPLYYLEYGQKYLDRFTYEAEQKLSPAGRLWRARTAVLLQEAMEAKRMEDPAAFAQLERDPDAFKHFAYSTHSKAYLDAGFLDLPVRDLQVIAVTPDLQDMLNPEGIDQMLDVAKQVKGSDIRHIAGATVKDLLENPKEIRHLFYGVTRLDLGELTALTGSAVVDRLQKWLGWK